MAATVLVLLAVPVPHATGPAAGSPAIPPGATARATSGRAGFSPSAGPLGDGTARYWSNMSGQLRVQPSGPAGEAAAWDPTLQGILVFGGETPGFSYTNSTWLYQNGTWEELSPAVSPPALKFPSMTYDATDGYMVLFGGQTSNGLYSDQTWTFAGKTWVEAHPTTSPSARGSAALAYDAADGEVVLYGGDSGGTPFNDSWTFQDGAWTPVAGSTPPAVFLPSMAYDASDREVVIFGGTYPNGSDAVYTWGFRGGAWSVLAPVAVPPGEDYSMMTPDPISGGVLLYELADDGSGDYTWTYANGTWTDLSAETGAGAMEWGQLAEDPVHGAVVYVGGYLNGAAGGPLYLPVTLVLHRSITLFLGADPASGSIEAGGTANFTAAVAGGIGGYRYAWNTTLASCASPSGMLLSCPSVANGSYGVSVSVSDAVDPVVNASLEYVVNITHVAIGAISATRLFADVGQAVTFSVATGGGIPPLSLQWSGLPPGCSGSGPKVGPCTVTSVGNFTIVARVADGAGLGANSTPLGFAVYADPSVESPEIRTASPAAVAADVGMWANLSVALAAPGAGGPYQYAWSDLPGGCAGNNSTLAPCRLTTPGVFGVSVKVTDAAGFDARSPITLLTVSPRMDANLSWFPVPPVAGGLTFLNATVEGGSAPFNFTWSIRGAFSGNGPSLAEVFGSPGPVPVTVSIRDAAGQYVNQSISPIVGAAATSPAPLLTGAEQLGLAIGLAAVVVAVAVILLGRRARGAPGEPNPGGAAENDGGASADVGGESGGAPTEEPMDPTGDEGSTPSESSLSEER